MYLRRVTSLSPHARNQSTSLHFYQNRQLELYASKEAKPLTLRQLQFFGKAMTEERLIKARFSPLLCVRIAHRLRDMQALPYSVVTQEGVAKVYELYWEAFEKFRRFPTVTSLEENEAFCKHTRTLLDEHATVIPNLTLGLSLSSPRLTPDALDSFMRRMLISRISRRVLAEHHIVLSETFRRQNQHSQEEEPQVGIIFTHLNVKRSVEKCAWLLREPKMNKDDPRWPEVIIDGESSTNFSYIREHLEYILFELLKNSMQATRMQHPNSPEVPPIRVTVVASPNDVTIRISDQGGGLLKSGNAISSPSDLFSFSHIRNSARLEDSRIGELRSRSVKGMRATVAEQVDMWNQGVPHEAGRDKVQAVPRPGIGLPMCNIYATYFGGSLDLWSVDGWGTDVFLRLPKLGKNIEGISV
ncbi:branched-chain alpha-ketoacid dehydrogenase [Flagelloscypha sp. PMI_526]|nr:branched-chain alpha-ketoacid dehydrogenase [Flagelloscypha sp. PMI_526]